MNMQKQPAEASGIRFVIEEEGSIVAWAYLFIMKTERHDEPYGVMENIYVEQEHRGKGYGKQIVQAIIDEAKKQGCYKLLGQSRYSAEYVHKMYEKFGFKDHGKNFRLDLLGSTSNHRD
jgi:GNAT superfamily N-acetyltransferase